MGGTSHLSPSQQSLMGGTSQNTIMMNKHHISPCQQNQLSSNKHHISPCQPMSKEQMSSRQLVEDISAEHKHYLALSGLLIFSNLVATTTAAIKFNVAT